MVSHKPIKFICGFTAGCSYFVHALLKMGSYSSTTMCQIGTIANLLDSILTILLICPNNDTVLCYSNDPFLTVQERVKVRQKGM